MAMSQLCGDFKNRIRSCKWFVDKFDRAEWFCVGAIPIVIILMTAITCWPKILEYLKIGGMPLFFVVLAIVFSMTATHSIL